MSSSSPSSSYLYSYCRRLEKLGSLDFGYAVMAEEDRARVARTAHHAPARSHGPVPYEISARPALSSCPRRKDAGQRPTPPATTIDEDENERPAAAWEEGDSGCEATVGVGSIGGWAWAWAWAWAKLGQITRQGAQLVRVGILTSGLTTDPREVAAKCSSRAMLGRNRVWALSGMRYRRSNSLSSRCDMRAAQSNSSRCFFGPPGL